MKHKFIITGILFLVTLSSDAQKLFGKKLDHWSVAITNSHSAMPFDHFAKLAYDGWHPGFEVGTGFNWSSKKHHDWFQTINLGYFYHRWIQHGIPLYTELGYRYKFAEGFSIESKLGAGYMHVIPDSRVFVLTSDGWKKSFYIGRPQFIATIGFRLNKQINEKGTRIFLGYQQRLQTPFINSYVPVLPYNILQAGLTIPFHHKH